MYVDFMAPADDPEVEAALKEVREHTSMLKILGSYRSAGDPSDHLAWVDEQAGHAAPVTRRFPVLPVISIALVIVVAVLVIAFVLSQVEDEQHRGARSQRGGAAGRPADQHGVRGTHDVPRQRDAQLLRRGPVRSIP